MGQSQTPTRDHRSFLQRPRNVKCLFIFTGLILLCLPIIQAYISFNRHYGSIIIQPTDATPSRTVASIKGPTPPIKNSRVRRIVFGSTLHYSTQSWIDFGFKSLWNEEVVIFSHGYSCQIVKHPKDADALVFNNLDIHPRAFFWYNTFRTPKTTWVFFSADPVPHATPHSMFLGKINWMISYKQSADIRLRFAGQIRRRKPNDIPQKSQPLRNRRLAFAAISYCDSKYRLDIIKRLQKMNFTVDLFGRCGNKGELPGTFKDLIDITKNYYFYLAFENSLCSEWITEKFYSTGLRGDAVPVVLGALSKSEYEQVAPKNSFIYAHDFDSVQQLGEKLQTLANNPSEYNKYHQWRRNYIVDEYKLYTDVESELCYKLHTDTKRKTINFATDWNPNVDCRPQKMLSLG